MSASRSSWTRRASHPGGEFFVKSYRYPGWRDRWRGVLRNTWLAPSRALREWHALRWLRDNGFAAPRPWGVAERRGVFGDLRLAVLVTSAWPAPSLEQRLGEALPETSRAELLQSLRDWVAALHRAGFRDRNLDPRNILARREPGNGWQFAKIDSPRFRLRGPDRAPDDALVRADHARLAAGLSAAGPDCAAAWARTTPARHH